MLWAKGGRVGVVGKRGHHTGFTGFHSGTAERGVWELFRRRQPRPSGLLGSKGEIQEGDKFRKTLWFWLGPLNQGRILRRGKVTGRGRGRTTEFHFSWLAVGHTWTELDGVVEGKVPSTR